MSRAICLVFLCIAGAIASPAAQLPCPEETLCAISNVDITPCAKQGRCVFKMGKNATINFDFTPEFAASELETDVSWNSLSFPGFEKDACKSTTCPVSPGVKQTFSYNLALIKPVIKGTYDIKWQLWNKANKTQLCCFITKIKILPKK